MASNQQGEREPSESARAWEAFCSYRDMGAARSLTKVAQKLSKSVTLVGRWCARYQWVSRIKAWDARQDAIAQDLRNERIREMANAHLDMAEQMRAVLLRRIQRLGDGDGLTCRDIAAWVKAIFHIERQVLGLDRLGQRNGSSSTGATEVAEPENAIEGFDAPDGALRDVQDEITPEEGLAAAHAILRIRRKKRLQELGISDERADAFDTDSQVVEGLSAKIP